MPWHNPTFQAPFFFENIVLDINAFRISVDSFSEYRGTVRYLRGHYEARYVFQLDMKSQVDSSWTKWSYNYSANCEVQLLDLEVLLFCWHSWLSVFPLQPSRINHIRRIKSLAFFKWHVFCLNLALAITKIYHNTMRLMG